MQLPINFNEAHETRIHLLQIALTAFVIVFSIVRMTIYDPPAFTNQCRPNHDGFQDSLPYRIPAPYTARTEVAEVGKYQSQRRHQLFGMRLLVGCHRMCGQGFERELWCRGCNECTGNDLLNCFDVSQM